MEFKFKVGDRVITKNPAFSTLKMAKGWVCSQTQFNGHNEYRIKFDKSDDLHFMIKEEDLEVVDAS